MKFLALALVCLAVAGTSCSDDPVRRSNGANCVGDSQCISSFCHSSTCLDPAADDDLDGLINEFEKILGTNALEADSDGDGIDDYAEVGGDINAPLDDDLDGIINALESLFRDNDCDGVGDQLDGVEDAKGELGIPVDEDGDGITDYCVADADDDDLRDDHDCDPTNPAITTSCDDADPCTDDLCKQGFQCIITKVDCDDGDVCSHDTCTASEGCTYAAVDCDDDDPCTTDRCEATIGCVVTKIDANSPLADQLDATQQGCEVAPCGPVKPSAPPEVYGDLCQDACTQIADCDQATSMETCKTDCMEELATNLFAASHYTCRAQLETYDICDEETVGELCGGDGACHPAEQAYCREACALLFACGADTLEGLPTQLAMMVKDEDLCTASCSGYAQLNDLEPDEGTALEITTCMVEVLQTTACDVAAVAVCFETPQSASEPCHQVCGRLLSPGEEETDPALACHVATPLAQKLGDHDDCIGSCENLSNPERHRLLGCVLVGGCGELEEACESSGSSDLAMACQFRCGGIITECGDTWLAMGTEACEALCEGIAAAGGDLASQEHFLKVLKGSGCPGDPGEQQEILLEAMMVVPDTCQIPCHQYDGSCTTLTAGASLLSDPSCAIKCAMRVYEEPAGFGGLGCDDSLSTCNDDPSACCSIAHDCWPDVLEGICQPGCEAQHGDPSEGAVDMVALSQCIDTCMDDVAQDPLVFAAIACELSVPDAESAGEVCGFDGDDGVIPYCLQACEDAAEAGESVCSAYHGFSCPLACRGAMAWLSTGDPGDYDEETACIVDGLGTGCDFGQVAGVCPPSVGCELTGCESGDPCALAECVGGACVFSPVDTGAICGLSSVCGAQGCGLQCFGQPEAVFTFDGDGGADGWDQDDGAWFLEDDLETGGQGWASNSANGVTTHGDLQDLAPFELAVSFRTIPGGLFRVVVEAEDGTDFYYVVLYANLPDGTKGNSGLKTLDSLAGDGGPSNTYTDLPYDLDLPGDTWHRLVIALGADGSLQVKVNGQVLQGAKAGVTSPSVDVSFHGEVSVVIDDVSLQTDTDGPCAPGQPCGQDGDCDDGDPCTDDLCQGDVCASDHVSLCVGPDCSFKKTSAALDGCTCVEGPEPESGLFPAVASFCAVTCSDVQACSLFDQGQYDQCMGPCIDSGTANIWNLHDSACEAAARKSGACGPLLGQCTEGPCPEKDDGSCLAMCVDLALCDLADDTLLEPLMSVAHDAALCEVACIGWRKGDSDWKDAVTCLQNVLDTVPDGCGLTTGMSACLSSISP